MLGHEKLTRGTIALIKQAIEETGSNDRIVLCEKICEIVEAKYEGLNLEYQLSRMHIESTLKILNSIDTYFYRYVKSSDYNEDYEL